MKILILSNYYPSYLRKIYESNPELGLKSYAEQYQCLMEDCFGWFDIWSHYLTPLGYEVWEIIVNAEPLQQTWLKEQGISKMDHSLMDILSKQIDYFKPDIIWVVGLEILPYKILKSLKFNHSSVKVVMGWCGSPYGYDLTVQCYDLLLSNIPDFVRDFRKKGTESYYINHAFDHRILGKINRILPQSIDFSFVGSIAKGKGYHHQREQLLKSLIAQTNLTVFAEVYQPSLLELIKLPLRQLTYDLVQPFKNSLLNVPKLKYFAKMDNRPSFNDYIDYEIRKNANPPVYGIGMYQTLTHSKITLNTHIDVAGNHASNMRLFETTGVGTCLLTDWKPNLSELFEVDREVVVYNSVEDCVEKVKWLLNHPEEREQIAKAGQQRTLKDHTFEKRSIELDTIIKKHLLKP